jgi:hypothetical protein
MAHACDIASYFFLNSASLARQTQSPVSAKNLVRIVDAGHDVAAPASHALGLVAHLTAAHLTRIPATAISVVVAGAVGAGLKFAARGLVLLVIHGFHL